MRPDALPEGPLGTALAFVLLAVVLLLAWVGVASPLVGWYQARALALETQRSMAAHMSAVAASLPALQAAARRVRAAPRADATLAGNTDAVAAAALQGTIERLARGAGTSLSSITILPGEPAGAWRRIGLRLEIRAPFPVLVHLLRTVLTGEPPMLIDDISFTGPALQGPGLPRRIDATFTVYAFRRGSVPQAPRDMREALAK